MVTVGAKGISFLYYGVYYKYREISVTQSCLNLFVLSLKIFHPWVLPETKDHLNYTNVAGRMAISGHRITATGLRALPEKRRLCHKVLWYAGYR